MLSRDASVALTCSALALVLAAVLVWAFLMASKTSSPVNTPARIRRSPPVPHALPLTEADALTLLDSQSGGPRGRAAVVMVHKARCLACVDAKPGFEAAAAAAAAAGVQFYLVDGELAPSLRAAHDVRAYPTILGIGTDGAVRRLPPHLPRVEATFAEFAAALSSSNSNAGSGAGSGAN